MHKSAPNNQYILQSVDNALRLLDLLGASEALTLTEVAAAMGCGKTIAYRLLCTLENRGYVSRGADNRYALGMRLFTLGNKVLSEKTYLPLVRPLLDELTRQMQETVHLVTWENTHHVILIYEALPDQSLRVQSEGAHASRPPHLTSTGLALLAIAGDAQIEEYARQMLRTAPGGAADYTAAQLWQDVHFVRSNGYAINNGRYEQDMVSIAVPVMATGSRSSDFAISISGPSGRILANQPAILDALRTTAQRIRRLLFQ